MTPGGRRSSDPDISAMQEDVEGLNEDVTRLAGAVFDEEHGLVASMAKVKFALFGIAGTDQKGLMGTMTEVRRLLSRIFFLGVAGTFSLVAGLVYLVLAGH